MNKAISKVWTFQSDSCPDKEYQTLQYADRTMSCNCPGWTRRVAADGGRSCKHTRYVDMGLADQRCAAAHQYQTHEPKESHGNKNRLCQIPQPGRRKITV